MVVFNFKINKIMKNVHESKTKKQETLEEAANKYITNIGYKSDKQYYKFFDLIEFGAKWQAERMCSKEEVEKIVNRALTYGATASFKEWFEQFKKK